VSPRQEGGRRSGGAVGGAGLLLEWVPGGNGLGEEEVRRVVPGRRGAWGHWRRKGRRIGVRVCVRDRTRWRSHFVAEGRRIFFPSIVLFLCHLQQRPALHPQIGEAPNLKLGLRQRHPASLGAAGGVPEDEGRVGESAGGINSGYFSPFKG
jgi:hypothetical protein